MTLHDNLREILFGDRVVIIVCFTVIIMLNLDNSLRELRGVPDGVKEVRINKGELEITTLEDDRIGIGL